MSYEIIHTSLTTTTIQLDGGTKYGGVTVQCTMYEAPRIIAGNPTKDQLARIDAISVNIFI